MKPSRLASPSRMLLALIFGLAASSGCVVDGTSMTMGDGGLPRCRFDLECDDGMYCNGPERCAAGAVGADARGCAHDTTPRCLAAQTCDETRDACLTLCAVAEDADGDHAIAAECGGTDCDDSDPHRFPGNAEVCDTSGHDEDCNPTTIGPRDVDGDGAIDLACCNVVSGANAVCGTDCADADAARHPGAGEICNGADDDCDGAIDETVARSFFPDVDHDGWGDGSATPTWACGPSAGLVENTLDCDDANAGVSPAGAEVCNGIDDDCDFMTDEPGSTGPACAATYGSPPHTQWACVSGSCTVACPTDFGDCDGEPSNGCESSLQLDPSNCGTCGNACGIGGECLSGACDRVVDVDVGDVASCAIRAPSGRVVCWGDNRFGELGDGTFVARSGPVVVQGLADVDEVHVQTGNGTGADASPFACARAGDRVTCWGGGRYGQIGEGGGPSLSAVPQPVSNVPQIDVRPATVYGLSVGGWHSCVSEHLAQSGTGQLVVSCWGSNSDGQTNPSATTAFYRSAVIALANSARGTPPILGAGDLHTCAAWVSATATPFLRCWGGLQGQWTGTEYAQIDSGGRNGCGVSAGQVLCWHQNGALPTDVAPPTAVAGIDDAVQVSVGFAACALRATGRVSCWDPYFGTAPVDVVGITDAIDVSVGDYAACAVSATSGVYCWPYDTLIVTRVPGL